MAPSPSKTPSVFALYGTISTGSIVGVSPLHRILTKSFRIEPVGLASVSSGLFQGFQFLEHQRFVMELMDIGRSEIHQRLMRTRVL